LLGAEWSLRRAYPSLSFITFLTRFYIVLFQLVFPLIFLSFYPPSTSFTASEMPPLLFPDHPSLSTLSPPNLPSNVLCTTHLVSKPFLSYPQCLLAWSRVESQESISLFVFYYLPHPLLHSSFSTSFSTYLSLFLSALYIVHCL
jgi:hypothetical protein